MAGIGTYIVIDINLIVRDMIDESIGNETSYKESLDKTQAILKFNIKHPNSMSGFEKYTRTEITQFLADNSAGWRAVV